jgi:uncharacterized caspase-like protein
LARYIGMPELAVQQMLTGVRAEVVASTRRKQVPWSNSSLLGEVYLAAKRAADKTQKQKSLMERRAARASGT